MGMRDYAFFMDPVYLIYEPGAEIDFGGNYASWRYG
jgi:hypothetical protein